MAWTAPRNWSNGELVTPALLNAQLRDNLLWLREPPSCRVIQSAVQSIPNTTFTELAFNAEAWDNDLIHSTTVDNGRLNPSTAGKYQVTVNLGIAGSAALSLGLIVKKNGTAVAQTTHSTTASMNPNGISVTTLLDMNGTTDYVTAEAWQNSGAAKDTTTLTAFMCVRVG